MRTLIDSPVASAALTLDQKYELYESGYVILKQIVSQQLVQAALDRLNNAANGEYLGEQKVMTDLINASALTPILHEVMGDFDPPTVAHIAVIQKTEPKSHFNALGYQDRDTPYFGAITHMDGNITMRPPQEVQQGSPAEIYQNYIASGPKGDLGRTADVIGHNYVPLFEDPAMTLALGSFTAFAIICLSDQTQEGSGQTALLKGAHHKMEAFFRMQYHTNQHLGPEGPKWPRLDHEVPNRCGLVYVPKLVNDHFTNESSATTPDGRKWAEPTQILMEPGDACIAMYHVPHTATRNENGAESRKNIIFRLRNKRRQPNKIVNGATDHPDRGFLKGEWLEFEEGNDPWERSKQAMCNMWEEWEGMHEVVLKRQQQSPTPPVLS